MFYHSTLVALGVLAQAGGLHESNPLYRELLVRGLDVERITVHLPEPKLADGADPATASATLRDIAGDDRAAREMLRDSVTAPFILRTRDAKAGGSTVRIADLWFVVHARLEEIDLDRIPGQVEPKPVEAGNMRFETRVLTGPEIAERKLTPLEPKEGRAEWFARISGRLLDRIDVEATNRVVATRTADSLVVAARTEPLEDRDGRPASSWMTLTRKGAVEEKGPPQPYAGGISYVKISRFPPEPGVLLVEAHFAFVEPVDWFQGNPILRSKIGLIAQDQVRQIRREVKKPRSKS